MATDNTSPTAAGNVNADPDYSGGSTTYYQTLDSLNRGGRSGQVLVTVNYNQRQTVSINGEIFVFGTGNTLWMEGREAIYAKRDGIVSF